MLVEKLLTATPHIVRSAAYSTVGLLSRLLSSLTLATVEKGARKNGEMEMLRGRFFRPRSTLRAHQAVEFWLCGEDCP